MRRLIGMRNKNYSSTYYCFRKRAGFTLIELMIVVAIVSILVSVAVPVFYGYKYKASRAEAQSNIGAINSLETAYATDNARYVTAAWTPASIPGLSELPWQTGNYLDSIGFSIRGKVRYRYSVGSGSTWVAAPSNSSSIPESSTVDIIIQAEGDVDGIGGTSQFYSTDETRTIIRVNSNY
jgi:prepilin-type N-terminal cleavage/methylation domain-containing protein